MSDETNKNPVPRVVKGTGFYTPMDIAPGEAPVADKPASPPPSADNSVGLPTTISTPPPPPASEPSAAPEPPQTGEGDSASGESK